MIRLEDVEDFNEWLESIVIVRVDGSPLPVKVDVFGEVVRNAEKNKPSE